MMKYSDLLIEWLAKRGYTHCFSVGGGNIMHLVESASRRMTVVPVIHEVAAGIAAEYFNESSTDGKKAFALVTAGPGLTNVVTAMAGAFLESRDLLVIGGQVKSADLARGKLRQNGIQEIDGVSIAAPMCVASILVDDILDEATFASHVAKGSNGRPGPVFLEICLDIQARQVDEASLAGAAKPDLAARPAPTATALAEIKSALAAASRPVLLIGGGVSRAAAAAALPGLTKLGVPLMTGWNSADRIPSDHPLYCGRPNTWGQRSANILLQQADLVIALGSRLGMQQTGFNWQAFAPLATVVQVDIDQAELDKDHPLPAIKIRADADAVAQAISEFAPANCAEWVAFCQMVRKEISLEDPANTTAPGYLCPFKFATGLSQLLTPKDVVIPCSSGGAFTVMMQAFCQKTGQIMITNKGLASMGYGLSGAIGAALANPGRRTILVEGDGGFAQNLQEIGTAAINKLPLKMFIFANEGYASIRMTQANYFNGRYVGCDIKTGLGLPHWEKLFAAYDVPVVTLPADWQTNAKVQDMLSGPGTAAFIVPLDPAQSFFPKIMSRVTESGAMESNPLHLMSPPLDDALAARVMTYLNGRIN